MDFCVRGRGEGIWVAAVGHAGATTLLASLCSGLSSSPQFLRDPLGVPHPGHRVLLTSPGANTERQVLGVSVRNEGTEQGLARAAGEAAQHPWPRSDGGQNPGYGAHVCLQGPGLGPGCRARGSGPAWRKQGTFEQGAWRIVGALCRYSRYAVARGSSCITSKNTVA